MATLLGILVSMQRHYMLLEQAAAIIKIRELSWAVTELSHDVNLLRYLWKVIVLAHLQKCSIPKNIFLKYMGMLPSKRQTTLRLLKAII